MDTPNMPIIVNANCLDYLRTLSDNSVDSVVTDPPYGLSNTKPAQVADVLAAWVTGDTEAVPATKGGFMGADWDSFVPPPAVWAECLRVLKPGGHMAVFAGARTQDLMGLSIRLAGFEIRDTLGWIYGSGFPKSMDISKAIDKGQALSISRAYEFTEWMRSTGITAREINEATGTNMSSHYLTDKSQPAVATADLFDKLRPLLPEVPERIERLVAERTGIEWADYVKREVVGVRTTGIGTGKGGTAFIGDSDNRDITAPATSDAARWDGWGTALKPAIEPIILARKPLDGTVAANVLAHGVGGLNIDASRVGTGEDRASGETSGAIKSPNAYGVRAGGIERPTGGRFPANVLLDERAAAEMDRQSGNTKSTQSNRGNGSGMILRGGCTSADELRKLASLGLKTPNGETATKVLERYEKTLNDDFIMGHNDSGGASRFFPVFRYQAKAPKKERPVIVREDGTKVQHPTVKPLALMEWLVTLITPPGGTVLDPFSGTGTTLQAARDKGFRAIGIEQDADYVRLIEARLEAAEETLFTQKGDAP